MLCEAVLTQMVVILMIEELRRVTYGRYVRELQGVELSMTILI